ncbi:hypothetical protein G7046_g3145 [Stylonectria norvegica]|nr:hypothetical protein G7046_g3145 [Stylonectria norvegica]
MVNQPLKIAAAPSKPQSEDQSNGSASPETTGYNCQPCVRRKVKCDRATPICSTCGGSNGKFECLYQAPPPRPLKRKREENTKDRLARYERILKENGLLSAADTPPPTFKASPQNRQSEIPLHSQQPRTVRAAKFLSSEGRSRYIDSGLWLDVGVMKNTIRETSEDDEDEHDADHVRPTTPGIDDPISGALLGVSQALLQFHPSYENAMKLWVAHIQNVEPLCKVLHIPTTAPLLERFSREPALASKAQECLLFAIYHIAVLSMSDEDCVREFEQSRAALLWRYQHAVRQALVNASWLKTTDMVVLQAYVLYLISVRTQIDPHTLWMLTGIAIRIAQRMGLHRDGEGLGLPPFDIQMRRRLFWQILPLDGYAGQISASGISIAPNSWDAKQALNLDDDQIYPGMEQLPEEQKGATEMIFVLMKAELSNLYTRTGVTMRAVGGTIQLKDSAELEKLVDEVENTIETKYLRYCDVVNPLHFLTLGTARSAMNAIRLRNRMTPLMNRDIPDGERRELCALARKIVDTDCAAYGNPNLRIFQWHLRAFFLWYALICILTSLAKIGFFSQIELNTTWRVIAEVYKNHKEILEAKGTLHVEIGKATLQAWMLNPPRDSIPEPEFISALRSRREARMRSRLEKRSALESRVRSAEAVVDLDISTTQDTSAMFASFDGPDMNLESDFNLNTVDWMLWDQLCHAPDLS